MVWESKAYFNRLIIVLSSLIINIDFLNDEQVFDIKIICKDKVINAHKIVLCSQSKVFKAS